MRRVEAWCWLLAAAWATGCVHPAKVPPAAPAPTIPCVCPALPAPPPLAVRPAPVATPKSVAVQPTLVAGVSLAAVGDVVAHGDVLKAAAAADQKGPDGASLNHGGYDALFTALAPELSGIDLTFANLETPIAPKSGGKSRSFSFNAPVELLRGLQWLGVRVVSFANNHVYDQNRKGFAETLSHLQASGLVFLGAGRTCAEARAHRLVERNGIKLAFLGSSVLYNQRLNAKPDQHCADEFDEAGLLAETAAARRAGADLVILSLHWGDEYRTEPRPDEIELAHRLVEGGIDLVLGHHPHVLRPIEVFSASDGRVAVIAYSLGNFISNQSRFYVHGLQADKVGNTRDGAILRLRAVRKDWGAGQTTVEWAELSVQPTWTQNNALLRQRDKKAQVVIRVVADDREIERLRKALAAEPDPKTSLQLKKELALLEARRAAAAAILGEDLLFEPPAPPIDLAPNNR